MENDLVLVEMKGIVECFKKECSYYEYARTTYLEKDMDPEWVHNRINWINNMGKERLCKCMRKCICELKIPNKDKSYLWNLLKRQELLNYFDNFVAEVERIITLST